MNDVLLKDKKRIVKWGKKGKKANDLLIKFPQYTRQQIAAIMAWGTMGKSFDVSEEDKKQIIVLKNKGKKANDLLKIFSQYSRQQIAAVMAWGTMGKKYSEI